MASYMGHEYTPAPKYKVGDRVQTLTDWGECAPKGSFGTVHKLVEARGVTVKIDGGDGFDWYYKLADVKPAPAQAVQGRYRVGDRVRHKTVTAAGLGVVQRDEGERYYRVNYEHYNICTDPEDVLRPAFRPGDRVKLNKHSGVRACGERGTVSAVIGDNVSVRMDDVSVYGTVVAFFHADNLDWERADEPARDCAGRKDEQGDKPKFKAGDRVVYADGTVHWQSGNLGRTIKGPHTTPYINGEAYEYVEGGWDYAKNLKLAAPCPQDNEQPKHKFKAGDKVFHDSDSGPYTIDDVNESGELRLVNFLDLGYLPSEYYSHTRGRSDAPCIVALISNGKPRPSTYPHVHASVEAATKEAERLARNNPGQEFAVYQRVAGRVAEQHVEMKEVA